MLHNPLGILKLSPVGNIEIEKKIQKINNLIRYHDLMLHVFKEPQCTIDEHMQLRIELSGLIKAFPKESEATQKARPISEQLKTFGQLSKHDYPVLDLKIINDLYGIKRWLDMVNTNGDIIITPVYTGAVIELVYVGGTLHKAVTKGCGINGIDITAQAYLIDGIPQEIDIDSRISIRGTVTISKVETPLPVLQIIANTLMTFGTKPPEIERIQQQLKFIPDEVHIPENSFNTSDLRFILLGWEFYNSPHITISGRSRETGFLEETIDTFYISMLNSELYLSGLRFTVDDASKKMELGYTSRYAEWEIKLVKDDQK